MRGGTRQGQSAGQTEEAVIYGVTSLPVRSALQLMSKVQ